MNTLQHRAVDRGLTVTALGLFFRKKNKQFNFQEKLIDQILCCIFKRVFYTGQFVGPMRRKQRWLTQKTARLNIEVRFPLDGKNDLWIQTELAASKESSIYNQIEFRGLSIASKRGVFGRGRGLWAEVEEGSVMPSVWARNLFQAYYSGQI